VHTGNPGWFSENFEGVRVLRDGGSLEVWVCIWSTLSEFLQESLPRKSVWI